MEHKEHKNEETKVCETACKKDCKKNMSCLKGHCTCMKRMAKVLAFIMLVIITISVISIAVSINERHENYNHGGFEQQRGMMQIYR